MTGLKFTTIACALVALVSPLAFPAAAQDAASARPWMDTRKTAAERVDLVLKQMTVDEKLRLVFGYAGNGQLAQMDPALVPNMDKATVMGLIIPGSAGYIPGIERLGIPAQFETDASIGVRNWTLPRTSLPSSLATAASWDPQVSEAGGKMIGFEARQSGFNVMLAGGMDLVREPRNGRNFEYTGEDPLLSATMAAGLVRGIQSNHIISTIKHFALNDQESGRNFLSAEIAMPAARQSDYLAFQLAIERADPGSVMCAYNRINEVYACENDDLLTTTLKGNWAFKGYVMSDWGGVHSTVHAANAGLDQQSGFPFDKVPYFTQPLKDAVADGSVPASRLDDMARRVLWAMFDKGVIDYPAKAGPIDLDADAQVALTTAEESLVLLKNNNGLLPLKNARHVVLIGSYADKGVLAGAGSSSVTPVGGNAVPGLEPTTWPGPVIWQPSSPLKALQALRPKTQFSFDSGSDPVAAAKAARGADVAIVFVHQWAGEGFDISMTLKDNQDALVAAVAKANPHTVVVVESGGAVFMPWAKDVPAILEAFYPGARGGEAIARILTGDVDPSGHLPISFPASPEQLVRAHVDGEDLKNGSIFTVRYTEGAAVGYKWHELNKQTPLFAFGRGLNYTQFGYSGLAADTTAARVKVRFTIANTGKRDGKAVGQVYAAAPANAGWEAPRRLVAFDKLALKAGAQGSAELEVDPRLLATYDVATNEWVIAAGDYAFQLGAASDDIRTQVKVHLAAQRLPASYRAN